jgi:hypothetical protein
VLKPQPIAPLELDDELEPAVPLEELELEAEELDEELALELEELEPVVPPQRSGYWPLGSAPGDATQS